MIYRFLQILCLLLWGSMACLAVPKVVVTIQPIHSLVAGIMEGVGDPVLLMKGDKSPHTQSLTPRDVTEVQEADLVIWIGQAYESSLRRVMETVKGQGKLVTLMNAVGVQLHPVRTGGLWGDGCHDHDHDQEDLNEEADYEEEHTHDTLSTDGHIWLDPNNAKAIVKVVTKKLTTLDPQHKADYRSNAQKIIERLDELDQELETVIAPVRHRPYIVYHDGTQYFDHRFQTKAVGSLMGANHTLKAQHLLKIHAHIREKKIRCIFMEPQFCAARIRALADKTNTKVETLDYLGVDLPPDSDAYFSMMRRLANVVLKGLG